MRRPPPVRVRVRRPHERLVPAPTPTRARPDAPPSGPDARTHALPRARPRDPVGRPRRRRRRRHALRLRRLMLLVRVLRVLLLVRMLLLLLLLLLRLLLLRARILLGRLRHGSRVRQRLRALWVVVAGARRNGRGRCALLLLVRRLDLLRVDLRWSRLLARMWL